MTTSDLKERSAGIVALEATSLILLNLISLTGNALVCLAVYRNPKLRTTTNLYIIALAACDLTSALFVMPFSSSVLIKGEWLYGDKYCYIQGFFVVFNIYASPCLMSLTAFNRYIRIVWTNIYHKLFSERRSLIWIIAVCLATASYILIQVIFGSQKIEFVEAYAECSTTHKGEREKIIHYSIVVPCFVVAPIAITSFCYYKIFQALRRHNQNVAPSLNKGGAFASSISHRELRLSLSLFVVVVVFALCWIPLWVLALLFRFKLVKDLSRSITLFITFLVFISSTINPFIYAGMNRSFRQEFVRIVRRSSAGDSTSVKAKQLTGIDGNTVGGNTPSQHLSASDFGRVLNSTVSSHQVVINAPLSRGVGS